MTDTGDTPQGTVEPKNISEKDFVLLLIALYRDHPELWKVKFNDYLNKNKKKVQIQSRG